MNSNAITIELHTRATQMRAWENHSGDFKEQFPSLYESYQSNKDK
mgnify:CR=1 FL=1